MKPAGPERDKQIAELIWGKPIDELIKEGISIKAWSTEFSASIALWEKMKASGYVELCYDNTYPNRIACSYQKCKTVYGDYIGTTEPDAISGAYCKWEGV